MTEDQRRILEYVKDKPFGKCNISRDLDIDYPCRKCLVQSVCGSRIIDERKALARKLLMQTQDIIATEGTY